VVVSASEDRSLVDWDVKINNGAKAGNTSAAQAEIAVKSDLARRV
jgi:hypothetical protein